MDEKDILIDKLKRRISILESRLFVAEKDAARTEQALKDALAEFVRVNTELEAVYNSKRWKVTAPIAKLRRPAEHAQMQGAGNHPASSFEILPDTNRKTVLVIDSEVPQFDKNAGARSTYQYVKLLADLGLDIILWGADFEAPQPYTAALEALGARVISGRLYEDGWQEWVIENAENIDYALINRPIPAKRFLFFIKEHTNAKIIYFGHDLHYLREQQGIEKSGNQTDAQRKEIEQLKKTEHAVMGEADVVVMYNCDEVGIIKSEFGVDATTVPLFFYESIPARKTGFEETKNLLFVGGFSHKPNVDGAKWFVSEVFPLIKQELSGVKLYLAGSNPPDEIKALSSESVIVTGFIPDGELEKLYENCRVCVIPLRFGAGVKGKTVEAMHCGIPIVSTSVGIEGIRGIGTVITAKDTPADFKDEVVRLYQDKGAWLKCSDTSKAYLEKYATYATAKKMIEDILGEKPDDAR